MRPSRTSGGSVVIVQQTGNNPVLSVQGAGGFLLSGVTTSNEWFLYFSVSGANDYEAYDNENGPSPVYFLGEPDTGYFFASPTNLLTSPDALSSNVVHVA